VGIESTGLKEVRGVEVPEASKPDLNFPIQCQRQRSRPGHWWQRWVKWHIGWWYLLRILSPTGSSAFPLHLEAVATLGTIIVQASPR
jgi:hypothetical protein